MRPVLVTRPAAQARALAHALADAGFEPVVLPTIAIEPVLEKAELGRVLAGLAGFRLVVFVSPNAIQSVLDALPGPWPCAVPVAVMGPGSRALLARAGIAPPAVALFEPSGAPGDSTTRHDSESLALQLDWNALGAGPVLIVKGEGGRTWLMEHFNERGVTVETLVTYRRCLPEVPPGPARRLVELVGSAGAADVIVTSSEGLANLFTLVEATAGRAARDWLVAQRFIVPHPRIAENATAQGCTHVVLAGAGDDALVRALK